jgi:serine/threonine protein phosphatase PrpC
MRKNVKYFGISVIGEEHIRRKLPCQDACDFEKYKNGYVAVISDGLGSKKHSDIGSKMACKAVIKTVKQMLSNNKIKHSVEKLLETIHKNWIELLKNNEISDCSTTCLFAIKYKSKLIVAQLGDGAIIVISKDRDKSFVLRDDKDNLFSNMTFCLNEKFVKEQWKIKIVDTKNILTVILCTDGISEDIKPEYQIQFAKEFYLSHKYLRKNQREKRVRKMLKDWHLSGSKDDKTIAYLTL